MPAISRRIALALLVVYLGFVSFAVFWPTAEIAIGSVLWVRAVLRSLGAPAWVGLQLLEFFANMAMFAPLGLLGTVLVPGRSVWAWGAAGLCASLLIEAGQLVLLAGRSANGYDVLANALGALLGAAIASKVWSGANRA